MFRLEKNRGFGQTFSKARRFKWRSPLSPSVTANPPYKNVSRETLKKTQIKWLAEIYLSAIHFFVFTY